MKELSIEEKAKSYDEATKRLEDIMTGKCQKTFVFSDGLFDYIFPELAESEDERIRKDIVFYIAANHKDDGEKARWLYWLEKQGEQKPAWSEEDEENRKNILYILNQLKGTAIYKEDKTAENCIDWLKSLKEKYRWKPSDEQLEALEHSLGDYNITIFEDRFEMLKSLYQDLKKLKG